MARASIDSILTVARRGAIAAQFNIAKVCAAGVCTASLWAGLHAIGLYSTSAAAQDSLSATTELPAEVLGAEVWSAEVSSDRDHTPSAETFPNTEAQAAEIPEEILRTEIITEARSPLTGEAMTAAEYAQLQAELETSNNGSLLNTNIRYLIFLLQFRRQVQPILPIF